MSAYGWLVTRNSRAAKERVARNLEDYWRITIAIGMGRAGMEARGWRFDGHVVLPVAGNCTFNTLGVPVFP